MTSVSPKCMKCMHNFWANDQESNTILVQWPRISTSHWMKNWSSLFILLLCWEDHTGSLRRSSGGMGMRWDRCIDVICQVEDTQSRRLPSRMMLTAGCVQAAALWPALAPCLPEFQIGHFTFWTWVQPCHSLGSLLLSSLALLLSPCLFTLPVFSTNSYDPKLSDSLQIGIRSQTQLQEKRKGVMDIFIFFPRGL